MTKYFTNNFSIVNLYRKPSFKSEVVTQMIFGESFSILTKKSKWLKVKIKEDKYIGYTNKKKFSNAIKPNYKIHVLKAPVYKFANNRKKIDELTFGSKIKVNNKKKNFYQFLNGWVNKKDVKPIFFKEKNLFKKIIIFKNVKYKWGGKSFKGIDCSGLVQVFFNFNNKFCPRDAKDQIKFFKRDIKLKNIKKNDLIYWMGHVAVAVSKKNLIHAYGPRKKTLIMNTNQTIKKIEDTANLKVKSIKRIN